MTTIRDSMAGGCPLFRITRALASSCDTSRMAASSYEETAMAVLAGASGTLWREILLDLANVAAENGQPFDACCALLAEVVVACADEHQSCGRACVPCNTRGRAPGAGGEPTAKRARTEEKESCAAAVQIAGFVRTHGHAVHRELARLRQEGRVRDVRRSMSCAIALLAEVFDACSVLRVRGRGMQGGFARLVEGRRAEVLRSIESGGDSASVAQEKHASYGRCPIGHLSVRFAEGAGGTISVKLPKTFSGSVGGQRDGYRLYSLLNISDAQLGHHFEHIRRVVGASRIAEPSVFRNRTGDHAPFRQDLHVDGAPSVIIPMTETGCLMDCLMLPDETEGDSFYYRVTFFVAAGNCVVFDTFHGGADGDWRKEDLRVHVFAAFKKDDIVPPAPSDFGKRTLKAMLNNGKAQAFLRNVPARRELEEQVGGAVTIVCKVRRDTGEEFEPAPTHHL